MSVQPGPRLCKLKALLLQNAFSAFFEKSTVKFDVFLMLVVDLMHEVELGVWKALLTHLIQILYAIGAPAVNAFNNK